MSGQKPKSAEPESTLDEMTRLKAGFLLQIQLLQADLDEVRVQNAAYHRENEDLKDKLAKKEEDENELFYSLQKKLKTAETHVDGLEEQLQEVVHNEERLSAEQERLKEEMGVSAAVAEEKVSTLESKVKELKSQLSEYRQFALEKDKTEKHIRELKQALDDAKVQHEEKIAEMERVKVQEKERLKREMLVKIKETKTYLLSLTEDQLDTTTKRTILENEHMLTELQHQYVEITRILNQLTDVQQRNKELSREVKLLREQNSMIAEKSRMIKPLTQKLKDIKLTPASMPPMSTGKAKSVRFSTTVYAQAKEYLEDIVRLSRTVPTASLRKKGKLLEDTIERCLAILPSQQQRKARPPQKHSLNVPVSPRQSSLLAGQRHPSKLYPTTTRETS